MDPKALSGLDPKLRETYERVMGATPSTTSPASTPPTADANIPADSTPAADDANTPTDSPPTAADPGFYTSAAPTSDAQLSATPAPAEAQPEAPHVPESDTPQAPVTPTIATEESSAQPPAQPMDFSPTSGDQSTPTTAPINPLDPQAQAAAAPFSQPLPSPSSVNGTPQEVSSVIKVLYIFGAVAFFAAYAFFWIRVFNYKLPF